MPADPQLMPWPWRVELSGQTLAPASLRAGADTEPGLAQALAGINAMLRPGGATLPVTFNVAERRPAVPSLHDDESYRLEVATGGVLVKAQRICGARHALTTLAQLVAGTGGTSHRPHRGQAAVSVAGADAGCCPAIHESGGIVAGG